MTYGGGAGDLHLERSMTLKVMDRSTFILNPPGFECGGKEDGPSTCVCASHVHCPLRRQFTVRGSARVYTSSLKCTQMHLHHITLTSPHPIAIGVTSRTSGKPSWFSTLHRALRRMAGLVFLLVFWVLAGACQRHGVGGFLLCNSSSSSKPSWFWNVCALPDALKPLLACFLACLFLLLCIVLSREYPGGHPTSDVSRVGT